MNQDHDGGYRFLFSSPEWVRDLIMGFVPDDWLHGLDYATLEKVPGHYVSEDFQQREGKAHVRAVDTGHADA